VEDEEGREHYYHFVVVVFGLGPAGQALSRVMRPILRYLADHGVRNMVYVDDGHVVASTKLKADKDYALTIMTFMSAGFPVAAEKSDALGNSARRKEYLGFIIDTETLTVQVLKPKMDRIKGILAKFLETPKHKVRAVASVLGKLISLEPALGKSVLVGTRLATITGGRHRGYRGFKKEAKPVGERHCAGRRDNGGIDRRGQEPRRMEGVSS
jgi:hypothetical protein